MSPEQREKLKEIIRREPTLRDTLSALDPEISKLSADRDALLARRQAIQAALDEIAEARAQLNPPPEPSPAEPVAETTANHLPPDDDPPVPAPAD